MIIADSDSRPNVGLKQTAGRAVSQIQVPGSQLSRPYSLTVRRQQETSIEELEARNTQGENANFARQGQSLQVDFRFRVKRAGCGRRAGPERCTRTDEGAQVQGKSDRATIR